MDSSYSERFAMPSFMCLPPRDLWHYHGSARLQASTCRQSIIVANSFQKSTGGRTSKVCPQHNKGTCCDCGNLLTGAVVLQDVFTAIRSVQQ